MKQKKINRDKAKSPKFGKGWSGRLEHNKNNNLHTKQG
jgi:hypothetical protein